MNVLISDKQRDLPLKHEKEKIALIAKSVVTLEEKKFDEVSIFLISDAQTRKIHKQFFNDPSPTDCMSFPMDSCTLGGCIDFPELCDDELDDLGLKILGEIFVCPKTAIEYAAQYKKNPYEEVTLYIVHGLLHLLGYDDIEKNARSEMRKAEKKHMKQLAQKGLILNGRSSI